uniref:ABC transporter ATP-binding protein n=1 Tax=Mesocestoides corti TaxID=53468 RepID=A0A5K3G798_MESCO
MIPIVFQGIREVNVFDSVYQKTSQLTFGEQLMSELS